MLLYLLIIGISMAIICTVNILFNQFSFEYFEIWTVLAVTIGVIFEIAIDGVFATIIQALPQKWFSKDKKCFKVSKKERNFYEKLSIKKWKDKVVELGGLGGFRKNKVKEKDNPEYINLFLVNSNKGIVIHIIGIIVGFLVIFVLPLKYALWIGLPIAIVNAFLNFLPIMVLRYNTPRLMVAYERALRTEKLHNTQNNIEN